MDRIYIDGFPRSGNTFSHNLLTKAFPETWIKPFTHSANALTKKHFVLIRNPNVAISSFMSVFKEPNKEGSERWWLRFHKTALKTISPERWIFFEDLTSKTEETIDYIGATVGLKPIKIDYSKLSKNSAPEPYPLYLFDKAQELYIDLKGKAHR